MPGDREGKILQGDFDRLPYFLMQVRAAVPLLWLAYRDEMRCVSDSLAACLLTAESSDPDSAVWWLEEPAIRELLQGTRNLFKGRNNLKRGERRSYDAFIAIVTTISCRGNFQSRWVVR